MCCGSKKVKKNKTKQQTNKHCSKLYKTNQSETKNKGKYLQDAADPLGFSGHCNHLTNNRAKKHLKLSSKSSCNINSIYVVNRWVFSCLRYVLMPLEAAESSTSGPRCRTHLSDTLLCLRLPVWNKPLLKKKIEKRSHFRWTQNDNRRHSFIFLIPRKNKLQIWLTSIHLSEADKLCRRTISQRT